MTRWGGSIAAAARLFESPRTAWAAAREAWRSTRLFALLLLGAAVIIGAHLRFHHLGRFDLSGDEGFSWASASASSVREVLAGSEPGKLPLYNALLHGWMRLFGDGVFAMRGMSAALGVLSIVLVFAALREVFRSTGGAPAGAIGEVAGAFAALLYATDLQIVVSDRTARMYALMMALELAQIVFFMRAQRRGRLANYAAVAILTALMIAANFSAGFLVAAEGLWLCGLLIARWARARAGALAILRPAAALAAGLGLLAPLIPRIAVASANAVHSSVYDWLKLQPVSWPYTVLRDGANSPGLFWMFVALGAFGVWRQWRAAPAAAGFLAAWTAGPVLAVFALSYLVRPLEFPRYVLIAFVGLFAFAALGAASIRSTAARVVLAVLLVHLAVPPVRYWLKFSHEAAWRAASELAAGQSVPGSPIAVFPPYCTAVVRYYLPPARRADVVAQSDGCAAARVLVLTGWGVSPSADLARAEVCYPRVLARLHVMEVRAR